MNCCCSKHFLPSLHWHWIESLDCPDQFFFHQFLLHYLFRFFFSFVTYSYVILSTNYIVTPLIYVFIPIYVLREEICVSIVFDIFTFSGSLFLCEVGDRFEFLCEETTFGFLLLRIKFRFVLTERINLLWPSSLHHPYEAIYATLTSTNVARVYTVFDFRMNLFIYVWFFAKKL